MSIMDLHVFDEYRTACILHISQTIETMKHMPLQELKQLCNGKSIHTPLSCKKVYIRQLRTLLRHFERTTNEAEGGADFCEDVSRRMLQMYCLLNAGVGRAHDVVFLKWSPKVVANLAHF